jgi:hypothetical protein
MNSLPADKNQRVLVIDDNHAIEIYVARHSDTNFTHALCPECSHEYYPGIE